VKFDERLESAQIDPCDIDEEECGLAVG